MNHPATTKELHNSTDEEFRSNYATLRKGKKVNSDTEKKKLYDSTGSEEHQISTPSSASNFNNFRDTTPVVENAHSCQLGRGF